MRQRGGESVSMATRLLDIATDFVPGVSFAKDAIVVVTGVNPITGEEASATERALTFAAMAAPAVLSGGPKALVKTAARLEHVAQGGRRSAHLAEELVHVISKSDDELIDLVKSVPCARTLALASAP